MHSALPGIDHPSKWLRGLDAVFAAHSANQASWGFQARAPPGREKEMLGRNGYIFVLVVLQTILGLACLEGVPRIYVDEAWDSALGYNLARTGSLRHPFIEGFGGMNVHFVQNRVVLPLVCAAIYKVAGYSVLTSRLASVIFAILAVVSLYTVMQRWFGEKQALWRAFLRWPKGAPLAVVMFVSWIAA